MIKKTPGVKSRTIPTIPTYTDGKEYIVSLNPGVDYDAFWTEIETNGSGSTYIPDRAVRIINERPLSQRSCHYVLTDAEATLLKNDSRVASVVIPAQHLGFKPNLLLYKLEILTSRKMTQVQVAISLTMV